MGLDRFISLDLETTGFSYAMNDIIEIGAWKFEKGVQTEKFSRLVRPVQYVPQHIQEMTGITMEMLSQEETIEGVLPEFYDFCGDLPFVGYNLPFDYGFLSFKGKAMGLDFSLNSRRMGVDVLQLVRTRSAFNSNKLMDVCRFLHIASDDGKFHRADYDAYMTKLVLDRYGEVIPKYLDTGNYGSPLNEDVLPLV